MKLIALVIVPSLPVNVSVPVHCDVGNLLAAFVVGAKSISWATNTRDRSKRTGSAFLVFLTFFPPHFSTRSRALSSPQSAWGRIGCLLFSQCRIVGRSEFHVCDKVTETREFFGSFWAHVGRSVYHRPEIGPEGAPVPEPKHRKSRSTMTVRSGLNRLSAARGARLICGPP